MPGRGFELVTICGKGNISSKQKATLRTKPQEPKKKRPPNCASNVLTIPLTGGRHIPSCYSIPFPAMSYDDADAIPSLPCTILLIIITPSSSFVKRRTKRDRIRDEQAHRLN